MGNIIFLTVMIGLGIWFMKMKAEKDAETKREIRANYITDPKKNEHPFLKKTNFESRALAIAITVFISMASIAMIVMTYNKRNPIIGKWRTETSFPFLGKTVDEVEFNKNSAYMSGMRFDVDYEIEDNKVILKDGTGIGLVYEIIDDKTMRTNTMGFETIYRKIE